MLANFENKANTLQNQINTYANLANLKMDVKCYSLENYPNGDNRVINNVPSDITLMSLQLKVEETYKKSPITLYFLDINNTEHNIQSDLILQEAIEKAFIQHKKNGNNGVFTLSLIVVNPVPKFLRLYKSTALSYRPLSDDKSSLCKIICETLID